MKLPPGVFPTKTDILNHHNAIVDYDLQKKYKECSMFGTFYCIINRYYWVRYKLTANILRE
jgi:hypothetical protein